MADYQPSFISSPSQRVTSSYRCSSTAWVAVEEQFFKLVVFSPRKRKLAASLGSKHGPADTKHG